MKIVAVDLDGTLLRSDMLHESFWSAFSTNWRILFIAIVKLIYGKAAVKEYLASQATIDVSTLPYNEEVIRYIVECRKKGMQIVLVTATNEAIAKKIACHLGIFDEVYGTRIENLKGYAKKKFLIERFGQKNFWYIGDSAADLPVWSVAEKIITVNAIKRVRDQVDNMAKPVEHISTKRKSLLPLLRALRPHQWLKNILIFMPMLVSHDISIVKILDTITAFVAFSFVASSVYIINDLLDLEADRAHPRKCSRPFASGEVSILTGCVLAILFLTFGVFVAALVDFTFLAILIGYFSTTFAYSTLFKKIVLLDIFVLSGLYTIRLIAGGVVVNVDLSVWLLAFSIFFFLSLASVKRQAELVAMLESSDTKLQGRGYQVTDLAFITTVSLISGYISVVILALYINSPSMKELYSFHHTLWGICYVLLFWVTQMVFVTNRGRMHDDPIVYSMKDKVSHSCLIIIVFLGLISKFL